MLALPINPLNKVAEKCHLKENSVVYQEATEFQTALHKIPTTEN